MIIGLLKLFTTFLLLSNDVVFYKSDALHGLTLHPAEGSYSIRNDKGERVGVTAMHDDQGILYWYQRINTPVCLTGECKLVDVGLYWNCLGEYFGIAVYDEHLTKSDHTAFSKKDYDQLVSVLKNDWSILREYDFSDLTNERPEGDKNVDGASGATRKDIAAEAVADAVYTTYTLWHLIHGGEREQLVALTADQLNHHNLTDALLSKNLKKYEHFLLDLFARKKLGEHEKLVALILTGLQSDYDPRLQDLAIRALTRIDSKNADFQSALARIYSGAPEGLRLRMISSMSEVEEIGPPLYAAFERDLRVEDEWFAMKILNALGKAPTQSENVLHIARQLSESRNTLVKESVEKFLNMVNEKAHR